MNNYLIIILHYLSILNNTKQETIADDAINDINNNHIDDYYSCLYYKYKQ